MWKKTGSPSQVTIHETSVAKVRVSVRVRKVQILKTKKMFSYQNDIEESVFCEKYLPGLRILFSQVKFLHYFLPILDNSLMSLRAPQIPESLGSIITRL